MEKKFSSSTLRTTYSQVNTVMKQKHFFTMNSYQRVQAVIKPNLNMFHTTTPTTPTTTPTTPTT